MMLCQTPFRVSLFGGGTDFPEWYNENESSVLSFAIDKYCYVIFRTLPPFFNFKYRLRYYNYETTKSLNDIKHLAINKILKKFHISKSGLEIIHFADLPALSGLGASSAFTVSLINLIHRYNLKNISKNQLAKKSIFMEQNIMKQKVGSQDQIACTYGGFNFLKFRAKNFSVKNIKINKSIENIFFERASLFYTGLQRNSSIIEYDKLKNITLNKTYLTEINNISNHARSLLSSANGKLLYSFSELLNETWSLKKKLSTKVSNSKLDNLYEYALKNGALSGKLLGAGGGGFFYFLSENKKKKKELIKNLSGKCKYINFKLDSKGSRIINTTVDPYKI